MDLELTDEQGWLAESVDTLLARAWPPVDALAEATTDQRERVWSELVDFGALAIGGEEGLGAVELCLIARSLGSHLAAVPFLGSAAARLALASLGSELDAAITNVLSAEDAIAVAWLETGSSWCNDESSVILSPAGDGFELRGEKVAIEHADAATWVLVSASLDGTPALALVPLECAGVFVERRRAFDPSVPMSAATFERARVDGRPLGGHAGRQAVARLSTVGSLLAAAEAIGAAEAALESARRYAAERRQFGRTIGSFQSLRHILADMHVRQASGWSTVLYAAAAFDDGSDEARRLASIAKAYVGRSTREVAHGAMQVFGGIAFTAEHPAHRFLRRIVVRDQQFGDASAHERALGRALAQAAVRNRAGALAEVR